MIAPLYYAVLLIFSGSVLASPRPRMLGNYDHLLVIVVNLTPYDFRI